MSIHTPRMFTNHHPFNILEHPAFVNTPKVPRNRYTFATPCRPATHRQWRAFLMP